MADIKVDGPCRNPTWSMFLPHPHHQDTPPLPSEHPGPRGTHLAQVMLEFRSGWPKTSVLTRFLFTSPTWKSIAKWNSKNWSLQFASQCDRVTSVAFSLKNTSFTTLHAPLSWHLFLAGLQMVLVHLLIDEPVGSRELLWSPFGLSLALTLEARLLVATKCTRVALEHTQLGFGAVPAQASKSGVVLTQLTNRIYLSSNRLEGWCCV